MISYLNSIKSRESMVCTPEIFEQLTTSPMVAQLIEDYRKGNAAAKQLLPSFMFQGYDPNVLLGKTGSRVAKNLVSTGMFIMDFDHLSQSLTPDPSPVGRGVVTPAKLYDRFLQRLPAMGLDLKKDVALAHITPSGDGLRLVIKLPVGKTIEEAQTEVAAKMETKMDGVVKDLSRQSFCPMASDILYINKPLLFSPTPSPLPIMGGECNDSTTNNIQPAKVSTTNNIQSANDTTPLPLGGGDGGRASFPSHYKGIPYKQIVDELIGLYGGEPQVGNRENTVFRLASDLAKITDRSAPWLESLIPTFGLPEQEWRNTIAQVCKKPLETSMPRKLQEAITRCKTQDTDGDGKISLTEYKDNFPTKAPALIRLLTSRCMPHMKPALSQMLFPALAAHVGNHKFLMGDNSKQELGLMAVLVGKQSTGKSCIDAPIRLICADIRAVDAINLRRKKEYNERRKNRKANERGEKKPEDLIIRCLGGNVTNPALLDLLVAAETGDPQKPNQCLYSEVTEIQRLYKMGSDGGKLGVGDLIKAAFDRALLDSFRMTADAMTAVTPARWNFSAATTPEGAEKFFSGSLLTDGTLSRISFVWMPDVDIPTDDFRLGDYDEAFVRELQPYIDNLNNYRHPVDDKGQAIPLFIPEVNELRKKINAVIDLEKGLYPDPDTYTAYAYRTRDIVIRQAVTTWIANGCRWEDCDDYWLWVYSDQINTKLSIFGEKAAEKFAREKSCRKGGRWSPLMLMKREFTMPEFAEACSKASVPLRVTPQRLITTYLSKKFIAREGEKYIICDAVCQRYNIR